MRDPLTDELIAALEMEQRGGNHAPPSPVGYHFEWIPGEGLTVRLDKPAGKGPK